MGALPPAPEPAEAMAVTPTDSGTETARGPRLYGAIDVIRPDRIAGWVIDRKDPTAHAKVEIRREGRVIATIASDRSRKDLATAGVGTGAYGFSLPLDPPLDEGLEITLAVRAFTPDGAEILLRPGGRHATASPERRMLVRLIEDMADCRDRLAENARGPGDLAATLARVELVQARLESLASGLEPPAPRTLTGLWVVTGLALAAATISLGVGIVSLLT